METPTEKQLHIASSLKLFVDYVIHPAASINKTRCYDRKAAAVLDISRRAVQLLFRDADGCTFMDGETYEQYTLADTAVEDELPFLSDGLEGITALVTDGVLLGLELPATVILEIEDCAPGMKAASSSARTKPATLSTGLVVQVPEYLTPGEKIKINTETREFISRA